MPATPVDLEHLMPPPLAASPAACAAILSLPSAPELSERPEIPDVPRELPEALAQASTWTRPPESVLFLTGPFCAVRRDLQRPRATFAPWIPRMAALVHRARTDRPRWLPRPRLTPRG